MKFDLKLDNYCKAQPFSLVDLLLMVLKEEANKKLSIYRQRQDDLAARMATSWPDWSCTLDFYTHIILPLKSNSYILQFINLSEKPTDLFYKLFALRLSISCVSNH